MLGGALLGEIGGTFKKLSLEWESPPQVTTSERVVGRYYISYRPVWGPQMKFGTRMRRSEVPNLFEVYRRAALPRSVTESSQHQLLLRSMPFPTPQLLRRKLSPVRRGFHSLLRRPIWARFENPTLIVGPCEGSVGVGFQVLMLSERFTRREL